MDQQKLRDAITVGRHGFDGIWPHEYDAIVVLIAAAESLLAGVPCNIQGRGVLGGVLWHDGFRMPLRSDCGVGANEVVDAVIVRLPSKVGGV